MFKNFPFKYFIVLGFILWLCIPNPHIAGNLNILIFFVSLLEQTYFIPVSLILLLFTFIILVLIYIFKRSEISRNRILILLAILNVYFLFLPLEAGSQLSVELFSSDYKLPSIHEAIFEMIEDMLGSIYLVPFITIVVLFFLSFFSEIKTKKSEESIASSFAKRIIGYPYKPALLTAIYCPYSIFWFIYHSFKRDIEFNLFYLFFNLITVLLLYGTWYMKKWISLLISMSLLYLLFKIISDPSSFQHTYSYYIVSLNLFSCIVVIRLTKQIHGKWFGYF